MTKDEVIKQALDALESERPYLGEAPSKTIAAIQACRAALAQGEQEQALQAITDFDQMREATAPNDDLTAVWMAGYHAGTRGRPAHFAPPQVSAPESNQVEFRQIKKPEQEPVAFYVYEWRNSNGTVFRSFRHDEHHTGRQADFVIQVPPQPQPLTDAQIRKMAHKAGILMRIQLDDVVEIVRMVEAELKGKT